jgi:hypothetical protein
MNEPVYGLTLSQNQALETLVRGSKSGTRSAPYVPAADRGVLGVARLMTIGGGVYPAAIPDPIFEQVPDSESLPAVGTLGQLYLLLDSLQILRWTGTEYIANQLPVYNPLHTRPAALFELSRQTLQLTVKFLGENLWGNVRLTIADISIEIDCQVTTLQLRTRLQAAGVPVDRVRITALPGLWEFAFDRSFTELPEVTCEPVVTGNVRRFLGGCLVTREGWRSVTADNDSVVMVEVIDSIPFLDGEVKLGAMALGVRFGASLYLCGQWSCPACTFRSV